jgi:hypothetical protein
MRQLLLAASAVALVAMPGVASAQYYYESADVYAPPPSAYVVRPPVVASPPVVAGPMVESQVYLAPGTTYVQPGVTYMQPGTQYQDQPVYVEGRRYFRDCWWEWGQRRCALKPWW